MVNCSSGIQIYTKESYQKMDLIQFQRWYQNVPLVILGSLWSKAGRFLCRSCLFSFSDVFPSKFSAMCKSSIQIKRLSDFTLLYSFFFFFGQPFFGICVFQNSQVNFKLGSMVKNLKQTKTVGKANIEIVQVKHDCDKTYVSKYLLHGNDFIIPS